MKKLILFSLTIVAVSCYKDPYADKRGAVDAMNAQILANQGEFVSVPAETLATPNAQGISHNKFSAELDANTHWKRYSIAYGFVAGSYKSLRVSVPLLIAKGCNSKPELSTQKIDDNDPKSPEVPIFYTTIGTSSKVISTSPTEFGKDIAIPSGISQLEISMIVDKACTQIDGEFDAQFK